MTVRALDHVNIVTADLAASTAFYREVLGLAEGPRPAFPFPGAWLYCGERPVVHLMVRGTASGGGGDTGAIDHVAFEAEDFDGFRQRLEARGIAHETRIVPGGAMRQIFLFDPDGVRIELNFRR